MIKKNLVMIWARAPEIRLRISFGGRRSIGPDRPTDRSRIFRANRELWTRNMCIRHEPPLLAARRIPLRTSDSPWASPRPDQTADSAECRGRWPRRSRSTRPSCPLLHLHTWWRLHWAAACDTGRTLHRPGQSQKTPPPCRRNRDYT